MKPTVFMVRRISGSTGGARLSGKKKVKFSKYKVHCYNTVFWLNSRVWLEFERFRFKTSVRTSNKTNLKSDTSCCWQNKNTERKLTLLHFCGNELMNSWTHELVVAEIFLYVQSSETDNIIIKWHHTHTHNSHTWNVRINNSYNRKEKYTVWSNIWVTWEVRSSIHSRGHKLTGAEGPQLLN